MPGSTGRNLMPHDIGPRKKASRPVARFVRAAAPLAASIALLVLALFSLPSILSFDIASQSASKSSAPFPVSVDPANKTITDNPTADELINGTANPSLSAAVTQAGNVFTWLASAIASLPLYQQLAGTDVQFVTIRPGYRQEEVAYAFGTALHWTTAERKAFLTRVHSVPPTLSEGEFEPGTYEISAAATMGDVQNMLNDRFTTDILNRYSTTTEQQVPLSDALTIASLIERETGGTDDMRLISGIIWNRLFANMNLQIDATVQYAMAASSNSWWPEVLPQDTRIKSSYNTYLHSGLPPGPIATPSIAAVIAALNPKPTSCLFYFHDKNGIIHCADTYAGHVALLKKYYGQGK